MKIIVLGSSCWDEDFGGHSKSLAPILARYWPVTYAEPVGAPWIETLQGKVHQPGRFRVKGQLEAVRRQTNSRNLIWYGLRAEASNLRQVMRDKCDVLITYYTTCAALATLYARVRGVKVLLIYSDDLPKLFRPPLARILTARLFNPLVARAAHYVVGTARLLVEDMERYNTHVSYIPNGVHLLAFRQQRHDRDTRFVVGFVGGFRRWVNFDLLIEAAKGLPEMHFLLVGGGDRLEYVRQMTVGMGNVELTGWVPHAQVPDLIARMDVGVIPFYVNELTDRVSPIKMFEYWAMGKPVVVTPFYEARYSGDGAVAFADGAAELVATLERLRQDYAWRTALGQEGKRRVKGYDWEVLGRRYVELIEGMVNGTG